MVGVGWFERSARKATLATLDVRPPSEGTAARGPADSYALEVETMVVIWRAGRPGTHHGKAVADDDRPRRTPLRQAFVWHGTLSIRNATRLVPHAT
jgi:hypothetical protein